jgi:hypothetical protein
MFGPSYETACPVCSSMADTMNGILPHLNARDVTMLLVSRAPLETLQIRVFGSLVRSNPTPPLYSSDSAWRQSDGPGAAPEPRNRAVK